MFRVLFAPVIAKLSNFVCASFRNISNLPLEIHQEIWKVNYNRGIVCYLRRGISFGITNRSFVCVSFQNFPPSIYPEVWKINYEEHAQFNRAILWYLLHGTFLGITNRRWRYFEQ